AYLVRRLLENGANTSFVNRIVDEAAPIEEIIADPVARARRLTLKPHPRIPAPRDIYGAERKAARGIDLADPDALEQLAGDMEQALARRWSAGPIVGGTLRTSASKPVTDP